MCEVNVKCEMWSVKCEWKCKVWNVWNKYEVSVKCVCEMWSVKWRSTIVDKITQYNNNKKVLECKFKSWNVPYLLLS